MNFAAAVVSSLRSGYALPARIGTEGRRRLDPHPDPGAAINALAVLLRIKRRRGYQDRSE